MISNRPWLALLSASLLVLLTACANHFTIPAGNSSEASGPSPGPVSISLDRSVYQSTAPIQVRVHNTLSTAIYAHDGKAACTILDLQVQMRGKWQASLYAPCLPARSSMLVKLNPGQTYIATMQGGAPGEKEPPLPAGTYRFAFSYSTVSTNFNQSYAMTIYSIVFIVTGTLS